jgi:uncharacterized phage protein gp47/JayE
MAFQLKDFASIAASMINHMRAAASALTDFSIGSVARTLVEAPAIEIDQAYQQFFLGLKEAIPVATYQSFDFERLPATAASAVLRFVPIAGAPTFVIPLGTAVRAAGGVVNFVTQTDVTVLAGATHADVYAVAAASGAVGNCDAGALTEMLGSIPQVASVSNLVAVTNGRDVETDDERKTRFRAYVSTLSRGTTAAIEYGAKLAYLTDTSGAIAEAVAYVQVDEPWTRDTNQPIALVNVYVHNGVGSTSPGLVARAKEVLYGYDDNGTAVAGWKAAGVKMVVSAATEIPVNVTAAITLQSGYVLSTVRPLVEQAITNYLASLVIGVGSVRAEIIAAVMGVDGVADVTVSAPVGNTSATIGQKIVAGTITVT